MLRNTNANLSVNITQIHSPFCFSVIIARIHSALPWQIELILQAKGVLIILSFLVRGLRWR